VIARDKVITELRLRMPASAERDEMILRAQQQASSTMPEQEDYETRQAVKVATETVAGLQARLHQKEIMLAKQKELLRQTREDLETAHKRHEGELRSLQKKLHSKHDDAFSKFKKAVKDSLNKPDAVIPTNEQVCTMVHRFVCVSVKFYAMF
jgi:centrosomal protein CEP290